MLDRQTIKVVKEFILLYKTHPCLWQIKSKNYLNPHLKEIAYNELLEKLREIDPEADHNSVNKKIQVLRASFHREHKRLENKDPVDSTDKPQKLWCYYNLLTFILDQVNSDEDDQDDVEDEYEEEDEIDISMIEESVIKIEPELVGGEHVKSETEKDPFENETIEPELIDVIANQPPPPPSSRLESVPENSEYNTKLIREKMVNGKLMKVIPSSLFKRNCEDKFDYFGKHIAFSLREMDESQNVIAQKLISEIIYRGQMKQLDLSSVQNLTDVIGNDR